MPEQVIKISSTGQIIRPAGLADAAAILTFYSDNKAVLAAYEPRRPDSFWSEAYWQARIIQRQNEWAGRRSACFFIFSPDNQTVLGCCNFTNIVDYPFYAATVGYALDHRYWGQGLMRATLQATLKYLFEEWHLHRVAANYLPTNQRSAKLLAGLGFVQEGLARDYLLIDGRWQDHVLSTLINPNWRAAGPFALLLDSKDLTSPI